MKRRSEIQRILLATDLDDCSAGVVQHAKAIASRFGAEIMMLHVVPAYATAEPIPLSASMFDEAEAAEKKAACLALERFRSVHLADVWTTAPVLEGGDPGSAILAVSRSRDVDLIVMGTHGRTGITRAVLGSVAEQVVHDSDKNVLTVRCAETQRPPRYARILCPVNHTNVAAKALRQAVQFASAFEAELIVLYLIENDFDDTGDEVRRLREWIGDVPMTIRANVQVRRGRAAAQVNHYAAQHEVDLIVLGAQKRSGSRSVIGSTTDELTRHSPCPVLTVPG